MTSIAHPIVRVLTVAALPIWIGCAAEPSAITVPDEGEVFHRVVESGGVDRTYQVFVPPTIGASPSVMISFHTTPGSGSDMRGITGFDQIARLLETIMVYPDATSDWAEGCGCTQADQQNVDDVAFVRDLLNDMAVDWPINRSRVYAVGFGQGGMFTQRLACELSDEIAAIAVVGATMSGPVAEACDPQGAMPFLMIHGTLDPFFPANGGGPRALLSTDQAVDFWRTYNQCGETPTVTTVLDAVNDGTVVNVDQYQDCANGAEIEFYEVEGGGHTWPNPVLSFPASSGLKTEDMDGAAAIGVFFLRHG